MQKPLAAAPEQRQTVDAAVAALLVVLCATWGLNQVAIKVANSGISPAFQGALRSVGSAALVLLWCRWRGLALFDRDGTLVPGLAAGSLFALEFVLLYWGLNLTTAARGVVFLHVAPFAVAIGAHLFVPGDRLTAVKVLGLAAAFAGIAIAFADALRLPDRTELFGDILCFGAGVAWGSITVTIKATRLTAIPAEKTLFYQLAVSALLLPPAAWLLGERGIFDPSPVVVAALAYQIVVVAFITYALWLWLMRTYPVSRLAAFTFLTPVFGVLFGWLLLDEPVGPALMAAVALVAAGIYLVNRPDGSAGPRRGRA